VVASIWAFVTLYDLDASALSRDPEAKVLNGSRR
jgi:hypothetical protein